METDCREKSLVKYYYCCIYDVCGQFIMHKNKLWKGWRFGSGKGEICILLCFSSHLMISSIYNFFSGGWNKLYLGSHVLRKKNIAETLRMKLIWTWLTNTVTVPSYFCPELPPAPGFVKWPSLHNLGCILVWANTAMILTGIGLIRASLSQNNIVLPANKCIV